MRFFAVYLLTSMTTEQDVEAFLNEFKTKLKIFDILFRNDRTKNTQALLDLEITPAARKAIIASIELTDFSEGPHEDKLYHNAPMWVFGKRVKSNEIYIKITMGAPNCSVICISFHKAEHPMKYPFKK